MAGKKISELTGSTNPSITGVTAVAYGGTTYKTTLSTLRQVLVDSGSHVFTGSQTINGNLIVSGSITSQQYVVSSSITNVVIQDVSGSSSFGNDLTDTHKFTGSLVITGSLNSTHITAKETLFVSGYAMIGDPTYHTGSNPEALHVGTTNSYNIAHFKGDNEYYSQVYIKNLNSGSNASTDLVVVADNGSENVHYIDLGINSSTYTGGLVGLANDSYLLNVGKDMYVGTVGGSGHPANLILFAENNWDDPQVFISGSKQVGFNTSSVSNGYTYEFSGSVKLKNELKVDGSVTASYFVGDGSRLTNLASQSTNVSMFLSSSTFNSFTQSIDGRLDSLESVTSSYFTFNETTMSMVSGENMIFQTSYSGTVIGTGTETATDSQSGADSLLFAAWITGSGGTDYPTIVNVQPNWGASGPGLSVGATVASTNTVDFGSGMQVYQITLNSGHGLYQMGQTYTFTEPDTTGIITKNWVFESGSNLVVPSGGNIIGAQNLATTGSNTFEGQQTVQSGYALKTNRINNVNSGQRITIDPDGDNNIFIKLDGYDEGGERLTISNTFASSAGIYFNLESGNTFRMLGNQLKFPDGTWQSTAFTGITDGTISGSLQISGLGYATTGSNTFIGNQSISYGNSLLTNNINAVNTSEYLYIDGDNSRNAYIKLPSFQDGGEQIQIDNSFPNSAGIAIIAQSNQWLFNNSGLEFPDTTIQTTAFTGLPSGLVSSSSQIQYSGLTGIPSGIISGSSQISGLGYATTGSNTFIGNQIINGNIYGNESAITLGTGLSSPGGAITVQPSEVIIAFSGGAGKEWNFNSNGNTSYTGNLNGVLNLATTGSNQFNGDQIVTGSITSSGKIGYSTGGSATQSSLGQSVTINQLTGKVTMASKSWNPGDVESFIINCNKISDGDFVLTQVVDSTNSVFFNVSAYKFPAMSNMIQVVVKSSETLTQSVIIQFIIIKAPTS